MNTRTHCLLAALTLSSCASLFAANAPHLTIPSSSRKEVVSGWNFIITAEGLYWVASEDGLYYAQSGASSGDTFSFNGHLERIHPRWQPGLRLGFGGNVPYDDWVTSLTWTYYRAHQTDRTRGSLLLLWAEPNLMASYAAAEWTLDYNLLDFELGRPFLAGAHFSVYPFFGIRGAWLDQDFHVKSAATVNAPLTTRIKLENDFSGAGIRTGVNIRYTLEGNWSFFGLASGSLLYGDFDLGFREKGNPDLVDKDSQNHGLPSVQIAGGARWDAFFAQGRYHLALYAAWEQNYWFNFNKMDHFQGSTNSGVLSKNNGALSLQGGTFGLQFYF